MRKLFSLLFILSSLALWGQGTYRCSNGHVRFNASTPLEDIDATNKNARAILKTVNGEFAAVVPVRDFIFRRKLMQEHFNENFMESGTYPQAKFSGTLQDYHGLVSSPRDFEMEGQMTLHGVTRPIHITVSLENKGNGMLLKADFMLRPEDYDIEVPKILFNKIAEEVRVLVSLPLQPQ